ncbi:HAMP domain-containing sensor histidine kinase [Acidimangrovimonas pyrenivorans]|uniref:histidine kinase n=1 Tax=Acidimangrovimonas pyrenivorans TaxID=2030798 RepID=A0ABV7ADK0_9RHOB
MRLPRSLHGRLALFAGLGLTLLWVVTATITAEIVNRRMASVLDSALTETAQRILPLAVLDIVGREEEGISQHMAQLRPHDELLTYLVRDRQGRILIRSHNADPADFPPYGAAGFSQTATHRLYSDSALRGAVTVTVAEPLSYRAAAARQIRMQLAIPLLILVPLSLLGIWALVRATLRPVTRFGASIATRGAGDLTPVPAEGLPDEIAPVAAAVNQLLDRLRRALEAERSFTANAAHELRTPVAAALAQAQRLIAEAGDSPAGRRAAEIEATLKRLTRLSEKLMQLAKAEGGRLRSAEAQDLRPILRLVVEEAGRDAPGRIALTLPETPLPAPIDADAFAILARNLIENALRHGDAAAPVEVTLQAQGFLKVVNAGPVVPPETLARLTARFARGTSAADGSGLGLSIARAIAEGVQGSLDLRSPAAGRGDGFEALVRLPLDGEPAATG